MDIIEQRTKKEELTKEIFDLLFNKFSYKFNDNDSLMSLVYLDDINLKIEMLNYLLSLKRKDVYNMVWSYFDFYDDEIIDSLTGDILKLYEDKKKAKVRFYSSSRNATPSIKGKNVNLVKMNKKYSTILCKNLVDKDFDLGFYGSIISFCKENEVMFAILNDKDELVGEVCLDKIDLPPINTLDTYNLSYYISPKYRNHGYGYEACKLLIDKALSGQLLEKIERQDKPYTLVSVPMNIKQIFVATSSKNKVSKKLLQKLGAKKTGYVNNFDILDGKVIKEEIYSIMNK